VRQLRKAVKVPVIGANFVRPAEQAVKENHGHIGYLEALLAIAEHLPWHFFVSCVS
jgi:hypothetical protein